MENILRFWRSWLLMGPLPQEVLRPPQSLGTFQASPRLPSRTRLSLSFSGEGTSSPEVPMPIVG